MFGGCARLNLLVQHHHYAIEPAIHSPFSGSGPGCLQEFSLHPTLSGVPCLARLSETVRFQPYWGKGWCSLGYFIDRGTRLAAAVTSPIASSGLAAQFVSISTVPGPYRPSVTSAGVISVISHTWVSFPFRASTFPTLSFSLDWSLELGACSFGLPEVSRLSGSPHLDLQDGFV